MNIFKNVITEEVSCPLLCNKSDKIVLAGCDLMHGFPGKFNVVKCHSCGLMRTNPRPTQNTMGFYYPDNYGPYLGTQIPQPSLISKFKKILIFPIKRVVNFNVQRLPSVAPGRMLEIGSASGAFLHHMASKGWEVHGIEFSEEAAKASARLGYHVHAGPLETAPPPDEPFDLIVGWMVLEHLHDPIVCLQKLREWAKPGAWLVLSLPNAKSLEFQLFKERWYALQLPNHLYHFTPETLEKVLSAGGWKMDKVYHQRLLTNLIASIGYVLRDRGYSRIGQKFISFPERGAIWAYMFYPFAWLFSLFGQTGRMTVWARLS